jgi:hypothetical protein
VPRHGPTPASGERTTTAPAAPPPGRHLLYLLRSGNRHALPIPLLCHSVTLLQVPWVRPWFLMLLVMCPCALR